jgi:hypothetical protein
MLSEERLAEVKERCASAVADPATEKSKKGGKKAGKKAGKGAGDVKVKVVARLALPMGVATEGIAESKGVYLYFSIAPGTAPLASVAARSMDELRTKLNKVHAAQLAATGYVPALSGPHPALVRLGVATDDDLETVATAHIVHAAMRVQQTKKVSVADSRALTAQLKAALGVGSGTSSSASKASAELSSILGVGTTPEGKASFRIGNLTIVDDSESEDSDSESSEEDEPSVQPTPAPRPAVAAAPAPAAAAPTPAPVAQQPTPVVPVAPVAPAPTPVAVPEPEPEPEVEVVPADPDIVVVSVGAGDEEESDEAESASSLVPADVSSQVTVQVYDEASAIEDTNQALEVFARRADNSDTKAASEQALTPDVQSARAKAAAMREASLARRANSVSAKAAAAAKAKRQAKAKAKASSDRARVRQVEQAAALNPFTVLGDE